METSITTNKGQIVIPKFYRKKFGIKAGTKIGFIEKDGNLIIRALNKEFFEGFAGILKDGGDVIEELMKEKSREKEA
mgnify:CR=1 FL=1